MERPPEEAPRRRRAGDLPPREMVSFRLGEQDFCIDIMNVREIRRWSTGDPGNNEVHREHLHRLA